MNILKSSLGFATAMLTVMAASPGGLIAPAHSSAAGVSSMSTSLGARQAARGALNATGRWVTARTSVPQQIESAAVALGHDGNIYMFGGVNASGYQNETYIYHPHTNRWSSGAPLPAAREGAAAVTLPDGRIALLGGAAGCFNHADYGKLCHYGTVYNQVVAYSPRTNSWTELAPMLSPRYRFAAVFYKGRVYAIGGADGNNALSSVEAYDPRRDRWTSVAPLPRPEMMVAAAVDARGNIAVMGGNDGNTQTFSSLFLYNGRSWRWGAGLPQASSGSMAASGADGRIYLVGGEDSSGNLATTQVYNASIQEWTMGSPPPSPRSLSSVVADAAGHIYVIGGAPWDMVGRQVAIYVTPGSGPIIGPVYSA